MEDFDRYMGKALDLMFQRWNQNNRGRNPGDRWRWAQDKDFARMLDVSPSTLSRVLTGKRPLKCAELVGWCAKLGVLPSAVFNEAIREATRQGKLQIG